MFCRITELNEVLAKQITGSALERLVPHASIRFVSCLICCQLDKFVINLCNM